MLHKQCENVFPASLLHYPVRPRCVTFDLSLLLVVCSIIIANGLCPLFKISLQTGVFVPAPSCCLSLYSALCCGSLSIHVSKQSDNRSWISWLFRTVEPTTRSSMSLKRIAHLLRAHLPLVQFIVISKVRLNVAFSSIMNRFNLAIATP